MQYQNRKSAAPARAGMAAVIVLLVASCARYEPRWTPQSVAPPKSLDEAIAAVSEEQPEHVPSEETAPAAPPALAENPALPPSAGPAMSLERAIAVAVSDNRQIAVERYGPLVAAEAIPEARAAFDPTVSITTSYAEKNSPAAQGNSSNVGATTSAGGTSGAGDGGSTETTSTTLLETAQAVLQATENLAESLEALEEDDVTHTEDFRTTARISEYLPTGTEIYVTGEYSRQKSSLNDDKDYAGTWAIGVNQALLRGFGPAVNLVALRQARNSLAISEHAFRDYVLDLVEEVERVYWDYALAQESLRIREFSLTLAEEQLHLNEALIGVGKLAESALVSAQAEVASQKSDLVGARADLQEQSINLWRLLNSGEEDSAVDAFGTVEIPELPAVEASPGTSLSLAMMYRPDMAEARLSLANRELSVVETKNGLLPRLDGFASYGRQSQGNVSSDWNEYLGDSKYDEFEVGLTFEMAILNRAERARHRRANLQLREGEAALFNLEQFIEAEVRKAIVEIERQGETITASHQEVLSREEELHIETNQFRLGRSTNLDVLQVQRDLIQAKVNEATAKVRYLQALTSLFRAEGTLLARRGVSIDGEQETNT